MAKKSASKVASKSNRKPKRTWSIYVRRALRGVNKQMSLSGKSMKIFNSFVNDIFERVAVEAAAVTRASGATTLNSSAVQTAVRLLLPRELAKHSCAEGVKAVAKASA